MKTNNSDIKSKIVNDERKKEVVDEVEKAIRLKTNSDLDYVYDKILKQEYNKDMLIDYFVKCGKDRDTLEENFNKY